MELNAARGAGPRGFVVERQADGPQQTLDAGELSTLLFWQAGVDGVVLPIDCGRNKGLRTVLSTMHVGTLGACLGAILVKSRRRVKAVTVA